jgi:FkbM family methyltransferase
VYHFETRKDEPRIIDCGANIGMSVLYFKRLYPGARITAFEPDGETFKLLKENIEANGLKDVEIFNNAVCGREGEVDFFYNTEVPGAQGMSTKKRDSLKGSAKVQAVVLSGYITEDIDFLKMDIEGSEGEVMEELAGKGRLKFIHEMAIEYHHADGDGGSLSKFLGRLEDNGFAYRISGHPGKPNEKSGPGEIMIRAYRK